jgi:hypothetical protein
MSEDRFILHTLDRLGRGVSDTPYVVLLDKMGELLRCEYGDGFPAPLQGAVFRLLQEFGGHPVRAKGLWRVQLTYAGITLTLFAQAMRTMLGGMLVCRGFSEVA